MIVQSLGILPSNLSVITLSLNRTYTITVRIPRTILEVRESTVRKAFSDPANIGAWIEVIDVKNPPLTDDYLVAFRFKRRFYTLDKLINNIILFVLKPKFKNISVVDFKSGVHLETKGLFPSLPSPTKILGNIKWIMLAGLGIAGLYYVGPIIKKIGKRIP